MAIEQALVDQMIASYLDRVRLTIPVTAAYLYGSYVSGEADVDSDIDLAVVSPEFGRNVREEMGFLLGACWPDANLIEAIPFSVEEHENPSRGSFIREVLKTGRRVA